MSHGTRPGPDAQAVPGIRGSSSTPTPTAEFLGMGPGAELLEDQGQSRHSGSPSRLCVLLGRRLEWPDDCQRRRPGACLSRPSGRLGLLDSREEETTRAKWRLFSKRYHCPTSPSGRALVPRLSVNDARDIPTIETPQGTYVPIVHASAGVRRITALAYMLMWSWNEHRLAAESLGEDETHQVVLLVDEIESHLHPPLAAVHPAFRSPGRGTTPRERQGSALGDHSLSP